MVRSEAEADVLKKFQVPDEIAVRVPPAAVRWTTEQLLQAAGMPEADARQTAEVLLYADLRGIDTHGVSNMLRSYLRGTDLHLISCT